MESKEITWKSEAGLTFIEVLVSITIIALTAGILARMVGGSMDSWNYNRGDQELFRNGSLVLERIVTSVRNSTVVLFPLMVSDRDDPGYPVTSYYPANMLAVSGNIDNDGDGLFDEDPGKDITGDGASGIIGIDDDNDGQVDEECNDNDDEAGPHNDDIIDGIDNDGDGRIDEDPEKRFYINHDNDDQDGLTDEDPFDPLIYYLNGTTMMEKQNVLAATVSDKAIAENVAEFRVVRRNIEGNVLVDIYLRLQDGESSAELSTTALAKGFLKYTIDYDD